MSLLQSLCPVLDLKIDLGLLKIVLNDSPYSKPWGFTPKSSLLHFQNQCYNLTPRSCPWPPTAPPPCSCPPVQSQAPENGPKWFIIAKHMGVDSKSKSVLSLEPKLQFYSLKSFLASYSPFTLFLTFRSIWCSWKWSQMIAHIRNPWVRHQNQLSSTFWTYSSPDASK